MKRFAGLLLTLALPLLAIACGGDDSKSAVISSSPAATPSATTVAATSTLAPASTVAPRTTPTPAATPPSVAPTPPVAAATTAPPTAQVWDARAVWDISKASDSLWSQVCNVTSPVLLHGDEACIVQVMQQASAPQQAIDFYKQNGYFIRVFMEKGRVDYARGSAPWINMGRDTQQLFLNGQPPLQEISSMTPVAQSATAWKQDARYAQIALANPTVDPWTEYGELVQATTSADGTQRFELSIPLMMCRACPNVAQLILDLDFDANGHFAKASLGDPQPPKQR